VEQPSATPTSDSAHSELALSPLIALSATEPAYSTVVAESSEEPGEFGQAEDNWLSRLGAWLAPLVFVGLWFAPLPLATSAHRLAAIVGAVLIAWVTEALPLPATALAIAPALVVTGIMPAKQAFAAFADPILFLFVGSFFVARAMTRHGLDRRLAESIATLPFVAGRPARLRMGVLLTGMSMSMWMSNTGSTAILLPVLLGMIASSGVSQKGTFAAGSVLALAHASTTGGLATIVGTPPNAITARILAGAGVHISFLEWMKLGVPTMLALTLSVYLLIAWLMPANEGGAVVVVAKRSVTHPWSRAERVTALAFVLAIVGWILPDVAQLSGAHWAKNLSVLLEPGAVAIAASSILFMVPTHKGGERVLTWPDAVRIEWGLILLFGGGIALGEAMFQTGLAKALGEGFLMITGVSGLWTLTGATLVLAIVLTEICSNTAAANMLVPLVIGAAEQLGVSPIPPALAVGFGASCGFMLPVATGPNAIAYGTGLCSARDMIKVGLWLDVISAVVIFSMLRLLCPVLGWD
jgi:solute carrier family 13 (sodium-dependent dicarboxylate transporter), member 2/3/5